MFNSRKHKQRRPHLPRLSAPRRSASIHQLSGQSEHELMINVQIVPQSVCVCVCVVEVLPPVWALTQGHFQGQPACRSRAERTLSSLTSQLAAPS